MEKCRRVLWGILFGTPIIQVQMLVWFESKMSPDLYFEYLRSSDGILEQEVGYWLRISDSYSPPRSDQHSQHPGLLHCGWLSSTMHSCHYQVPLIYMSCNPRLKVSEPKQILPLRVSDHHNTKLLTQILVNTASMSQS